MANKFKLLKIDDEFEKVEELNNVVKVEEKVSTKVGTKVEEKVEEKVVEKVSTKVEEKVQEKVEEKVEEKVDTEVEESEKMKEYDSSSSEDDEEDDEEEESDEDEDEEDSNHKKWCACSCRHSDTEDESDEEEEEEEEKEEENKNDFIYVLYDNNSVKTYSECYDTLNEHLEKLIKETTTNYIHLGEIYVHPETKKDGDYYKLFFFKNSNSLIFRYFAIYTIFFIVFTIALHVLQHQNF